MDCRIFYHDHCFDGACSASLFTKFHRECVGTAAAFSYRGLVHKAGALFDEGEFVAGENAIVDFKYWASPKLTWWFDHHLSAFSTPEEHAAFERGQVDGAGPGKGQAGRQFYDASYISCTKLIAEVAVERFGFDAGPVAELIHWANIVDGAKYVSAEAAVGMAEPAMRLTLAIETAGAIESSSGETFSGRLIPLLTEMPLTAVLEQPFVQEALQPVLARHWEAVDVIQERAAVGDGVITFDLMDLPGEGYNKFIPYFLHPEGTYVVGLSRSSFRVKISVGTNPWTPLAPGQLVNLAAICERYGGGGHARVGAISFPPGAEEAARVAAGEIAAELRGA